MRTVRIPDDATRATLEQGIGRLRAKLASTEDPEMRAEIEADTDELLEMWARAEV